MHKVTRLSSGFLLLDQILVIDILSNLKRFQQLLFYLLNFLIGADPSLALLQNFPLDFINMVHKVLHLGGRVLTEATVFAYSGSIAVKTTLYGSIR